MSPEEHTASPSHAADEVSLNLSYAITHLRFGWWSLLVFLTLGIVLESLHGFKIRAYLDVSNETRRLMWTLAHAHGTLFALIHLSFSSLLFRLKEGGMRSIRTCSSCLIGASFLMPAGFFFGGVFIHAGDPGLSVMLVPIGAFLLLAAVFMAARAADGMRNSPAAISAESSSKGKPRRDKSRKDHRA